MPKSFLSFNGPSSSGESAEATVIVHECQDLEQAIAVAFGEAPSVLLGLPREAIPASAKPIGFETYEVTFSYPSPDELGDNSPPEPPNETTPSDAVLEFDTGGGSQHITTAIQQRRTPGAPDRFRAIGVSVDKGGDVSVEGVDVVIPDFNFSLTIQWPAQAINNAGGGSYIFGLYGLTGRTNSSPYTVVGTFQGVPLTMTFAAGELLFMGARGSGSGRFLSITYSFKASPNKQVTVDDEIQAISKKGHEYLWVQFKTIENTTPPGFVQRPQFVYVAQVYDEADFQQILGF